MDDFLKCERMNEDFWQCSLLRCCLRNIPQCIIHIFTLSFSVYTSAVKLLCILNSIKEAVSQLVNERVRNLRPLTLNGKMLCK